MSYQVWIADDAKGEIKRLPGNMRQRIPQAIRDLSLDPRPHDSRPMKSPLITELELRRLRLERWRVIYIVDEQAAEVGVLAVRKRPPYDYSDLPDLLAEI
jgi:mRNA-degrading endonuclease RelE of RelBE toxin-antitoxin system